MNTQQKIEQYRQWLQGIVENTDGDTTTVMKVVIQKFNELFPEEQQSISDDHALQVMVDMDSPLQKAENSIGIEKMKEMAARIKANTPADDTDRIYPK